MGDDGEPIQVWLIPGHQRVQRWQSGHTSHHASRHVTVGVLPDGRWYADSTAPTIGARAYPSEAVAREAADRLMAEHGGDWVEVPANLDANNKPTEPGWVRRGGDWVRG